MFLSNSLKVEGFLFSFPISHPQDVTLRRIIIIKPEKELREQSNRMKDILGRTSSGENPAVTSLKEGNPW